MLVPHFINGQSVPGESRTGVVYNPATGAELRTVSLADAKTLDDAIAAAEAALPGWRKTGLAKRAAVMFNLHNIITSRREELAAVISKEHGKVLSDAAGEIVRGLENVEFCAGLVHHMKGEFLEQAASGVDVHQVRQPVGVVACITPFNFPAMVPLWMVTTAIAAGNTVILKPSERDPSAANWLAAAFKEAGLPDGVLNVVHGDKEAVDYLIASDRVKAISFVGSTPVAKAIYSASAANGKRVQALGGAKNHMIVMPDADLDSAADAAVSAGYGSAGERCMAISVVVAVGAIADELVEKIKERTLKLKTVARWLLMAALGISLMWRERAFSLARLSLTMCSLACPAMMRKFSDQCCASCGSIPTMKPWRLLMPINLPMAPAFSLAMAAPLGNLNSILKSAWWALTSPFRYLSGHFPSVVGRTPCLAILTCTARSPLTSILGVKWSLLAGRCQMKPRSTLVSPPTNHKEYCCYDHQ